MDEPVFKLTTEGKDKTHSVVVISPLSAGYGQTLGNALRRVMLTSIAGAAITSVKVSGVKHEFSTLTGMKEDLVEFILNLKKVRFAYDKDDPVQITLSVKGKAQVKASDMKLPANVTVANPDFVLSNLSKDSKLEAVMTLERGVGYLPAEGRERNQIGLIPVDASFSPVKRVNFKVEETRVGRLTNYDKLVLEVWTDGTITPKDAVLTASRILVSYLNQLINPKKVVESVSEPKDSLGPEGRLSVEEIGLPTRVANALTRAGFETVSQLVNAKRANLVKVRNLGEKSLKIVDVALAEKGIEAKIK